jgi:protein SCO1/2
MNWVYVWGLVVAALIAFALSVAGQPGLLGERPAPQAEKEGVALIGGPFALVDGGGATVTDQNFAGRHMLVSFGFTSCPDVCPTLLITVGQTLDALGDDAAALQALFITVDPERDTPDVVAAYVKKFHPNLVGLSGSVEQVAAAAATYRIYYARVPNPDTAEGDTDDYTIDHSAYLYLMGPDGAYLAHFTHRSTVEEIVGVIRDALG